MTLTLTQLYTTYHADKAKCMTSLHDADGITVDCYEAAHGLFNRTMTVAAFINMLSCNTILRKAQCTFLTKGSVTATDLVYDLCDELYSAQTKKFNLSEIISDDTLRNCRIELPKSLSYWITDNAVNAVLQNAITEFKENSIRVDTGYVPKKILSELKLLYNNLSHIDFTVHVGHAGCGKSTTVAKYVNSNNLHGSVIALSNTISNMMSVKSSNLTPFSCTSALANYTYDTVAAHKNLTNQEVIVIDEFSQWGFNELSLLNNIIAHNMNSKFFFMGDIDQIPTFLSSGSLLYSIMQSFSSHIVQHNVQHRFKHVPEYLTLLTAVQEHKLPANLIVHDMNNDILRLADVCITGTNAHVKLLNTCMLQLKHNIDPSNMKLHEVMHNDCTIPLICTTTTTLQSSKQKVKRNSKYTVYNVGYNKFTLTCETDKSMITCNNIELDMFFDYGYAMTVNRSQGLEWDNVLVYMDQCDRNLMNYNALYVALSRGKNNLIVSTFNPKVTINDIAHFINTTYKYTNHFNSIEV